MVFIMGGTMITRRMIIANQNKTPPPIQLVQNGNFAAPGKWGTSRSYLSFSNNTLTVTAKTVSDLGYGTTSWDYDLGMVNGHKYLISFYCKPVNEVVRIQAHGKSLPIQTLIPNQSNHVQLIFTDSGTVETSQLVVSSAYRETYEVGDYFELSKFNLIDLTATFGEGNEPSTVEEFRDTYPNDFYEYNP